jgi:hypothetical protein
MATPQRAPVRPRPAVRPAVAGPLERGVRTLAPVAALLFAGYVLWPVVLPETPRPAEALVSQAGAAVVEMVYPPARVDQHFSGCNEARAAGREDIPSNDPSYRPWMDGDSDGWACEPHW